MKAEYEGGTSCDLVRPYVEGEVRAIGPRSVVDFGAGAGKMGTICRTLLGDQVHLTAVEGCRETVALLSESGLYNRVDHALLQDWLRSNTGTYDLAIFGDVLEHLTRRQAFAAVNDALKIAPNVIVNVPLRNLHQDAFEANPLEEHKAYLTEHCFSKRFLMREMHVVSPGPGWSQFNAWIVARKKFRLKTSIKHGCLFVFGRKAKAVFTLLGYDIYVGK